MIMKNYLFIILVFTFFESAHTQITIKAQLSNFRRKTPLMGLNGNAIYNNTWTNPALVDSIKNLNPSIIRYPGGTPGNYWDWKTGWPVAPFSSCYPNGPLPKLMVRHNELKIGLDSCHADMLYTINMMNSNLSYQLQGLNNASGLAIPVKYIEIGNEHNLTCDPISSSTYASMSKIWADSIKAHYPKAKICLVGGDIPSSAPNWIRDISLQPINYNALSFHVYPLPALSPFNVKNALAIAYNTTGMRYSVSHFSNVPTKEVWVTECNMSTGNTSLSNSWTQTLFLLTMMDTLISINQVTMILPWAYSGPNLYLQSLDYNDFSMKATGVAVKFMNDISRGMDSCQKIKFTPDLYQNYNGITYPAMFGYTFYNDVTSKTILVNLSSSIYNLDLSSLGNVASYSQYYADTAQLISNGFQNLNKTSGRSSPILIQPYSVVLIDYSIMTDANQTENNIKLFTIFPNPANDKLNMKGIPLKSQFRIYDANGQAELEGIYKDESIDISRLKAGLHFLAIIENNRIALAYKFIR